LIQFENHVKIFLKRQNFRVIGKIEKKGKNSDNTKEDLSKNAISGKY